ncbi:MAG: hypothetical protein AAFP04_03860 [Myxococcota bacterium]
MTEVNPFDVLELKPGASTQMVERRGRELLGKIELGFKGAERFRVGVIEHLRDEAIVRWALDQLRQPDRRLIAELQFIDVPTDAPTSGNEPYRWRDALKRFGF